MLGTTGPHRRKKIRLRVDSFWLRRVGYWRLGSGYRPPINDQRHHIALTRSTFSVPLSSVLLFRLVHGSVHKLHNLVCLKISLTPTQIDNVRLFITPSVHFCRTKVNNMLWRSTGDGESSEFRDYGSTVIFGHTHFTWHYSKLVTVLIQYTN